MLPSNCLEQQCLGKSSLIYQAQCPSLDELKAFANLTDMPTWILLWKIGVLHADKVFVPEQTSSSILKKQMMESSKTI